jgi:hypothetical protein
MSAETQCIKHQNPYTARANKSCYDIKLTNDSPQCHSADIPFLPFQQGILLKLEKDLRNFIDCVEVVHRLPKPVEDLPYV